MFKQAYHAITIILSLTVVAGCFHTKPKDPIFKFWVDLKRIPVYPPKSLDVGQTIRIDDYQSFASLEDCYNLDSTSIKEGYIGLPKETLIKGVTVDLHTGLKYLNKTGIQTNNYQERENKKPQENIGSEPVLKLTGRLNATKFIHIKYSDTSMRYINIKDLLNNVKEECREYLDTLDYITIAEADLATVQFTFIKADGGSIRLESELTSEEKKSLVDAGVNLSAYRVLDYSLENKNILVHGITPAVKTEKERKAIRNRAPKSIDEVRARGESLTHAQELFKNKLETDIRKDLPILYDEVHRVNVTNNMVIGTKQSYIVETFDGEIVGEEKLPRVFRFGGYGEGSVEQIAIYLDGKRLGNTYPKYIKGRIIYEIPYEKENFNIIAVDKVDYAFCEGNRYYDWILLRYGERFNIPGDVKVNVFFFWNPEAIEVFRFEKDWNPLRVPSEIEKLKPTAWRDVIHSLPDLPDHSLIDIVDHIKIGFSLEDVVIKDTFAIRFTCPPLGSSSIPSVISD